MASGRATPGVHGWNGGIRGRVRLVRNHEVGQGTPFSGAAYDAQGGGGTVTLEFDAHRGAFVGAQDSLGGTIRNCAGGPTPWGTWLTCEETNDFTTVPHGYVFEVPVDGLGDPIPLRDMGRVSHEAVAVDPVSGYVYETEDAGASSGFYRFVPSVRHLLASGGLLFMLTVKNAPLANLGGSYAVGAKYDIEWVPISRRGRHPGTPYIPRRVAHARQRAGFSTRHGDSRSNGAVISQVLRRIRTAGLRRSR